MPTELTTTNNAYRYPTSGNNGASFALGIADLAADVDAMDLSGTLAARPAASKLGRTYYATDTGQVFRDSGAAWLIIYAGGSWAPLTLASGWATYSGNGGYYTPAARIVGDQVFLSGAATNAGATSPCAALLNAPVSAVRLPQPGGSGTTFLTIAAGSTSVTTTGAPTIVYFDGLSYRLS